MDLDFSRDFDCWDNCLPGGCTLTSVRQSGNRTESVATVKMRPVNRKEIAASNGVYTSLDVVFLLPGILVHVGPLKPRDLVTVGGQIQPGAGTSVDQGTIYTTLEAAANRRDGSGNPATWRLICRDPIIAYDLQDTITIEQASDDRSTPAVLRLWPSDSNSPSRGGSVIVSNLPCRVQPQQAETVQERGLEGQETKYTIYLSQQIAFANIRECRVLWKGKILSRLVYHDAERIDLLPVLEAILEV